MSACFQNVDRKIDRAGGSIVYGWAIWHVPRLYFEAEHHGVWRNRSGVLVDVSPQLGEVPKILFLPDPAAVYESGRYRPNIYEPAADDPVAHEFVELSRARNAIIDSYRKEFTLVYLRNEDQAEVDRINSRLKAILETHSVR